MTQGLLKSTRVETIGYSKIPGNQRSLFAAALLILAMLVAYFPTALEYYAVWRGNITYLHGFIVGPLAFGMIVFGAQRLEFDWRRQSLWLVAAAAFTGLVWLVAYLSATQVVQQLALIVLLYFGLVGLFGRQGMRAFLLPISILVLATPVWDILIDPLVTLTTTVNTWLLIGLGRTAYIDGNLVQLAAGAFRIIDDCSGIHFFIVGQILAIVAAHIYLRTMIGKITLLLSTAVITLVSNWLRVFIIILAGDLTDMQHFLVTVDHYYFGWVMFACLMIPFLLVVRQVGDAELAYLQRSTLERKLQDIVGNLISKGLGSRFARSGPLVLAVALFGGPAYAYYLAATAEDRPAIEILLPSVLGSWTQVPGVDIQTSLKPYYEGAAAELLEVFQSGDTSISVYANRYDRQQQGAELVGYGNRPFADLNIVTRTDESVTELGVHVTELEAIGRGKRKAILRTFIVGNTAVPGEVTAKLLTGLYPLIGKMHSGVVLIASDCDSDCAKAHEVNRHFLIQAWPDLSRQVGDWPADDVEG